MTLGELRDAIDEQIKQNSPHCETDVRELVREVFKGFPTFRLTQSSIALETTAGRLRDENYRLLVRVETLEKALREEKDRTVAASVSLPI